MVSIYELFSFKIEKLETNRRRSMFLLLPIAILENCLFFENEDTVTLFEKANFCLKIQFLQKTQLFHKFFTQNFFDNFSRENKVVNS